MTYKIIGDSCLDLTEDMKKDPRFQMIPLTLQVGSAQVVDDETFDQKRFIEMVKACPECPKTACPSPETFKAAFEEAEAEAVFVITLSSHLSGSYNSAAVAKKLYEEEMTEKGMAEQAKKVAVIDSLSASSGELNIALFIQNLCDSGLEFDEVVEKTLAYRDGMNTYFVLESLDTLRKNGRLSGLQAFFRHSPQHQACYGRGYRNHHQAGPGQGNEQGPSENVRYCGKGGGGRGRQDCGCLPCE